MQSSLRSPQCLSTNSRIQRKLNFLPEFSSVAPPDGGTGGVGSCPVVFSPYAPGKINRLIEQLRLNLSCLPGNPFSVKLCLTEKGLA